MGRGRVAGAAAALACVSGCSLLVSLDGLSTPDASDAASETADAPSDSTSSDATTDGGPNEGPVIAYATSSGVIRTRRWLGATSAASWSPAVDGPSVPAGSVPRWVLARRGQGAQVLGVMSSVGVVSKLTVYDLIGSTWTAAFDATGFTTKVQRRPFDIAFESKSGRAVVAWGGTDGNVRFRVREGSTWSAESAAFPSSPAGPIHWLELASSPTSNDLTMVIADDFDDVFASRWDDGRFSPADKLEDKIFNLDFKAFSVAYEQKSGDALIVWGFEAAPNTGVRFTTASAGTSSYPPAKLVPETAGIPGAVVALAPDPSSDRVALSYLESVCGGGSCDDFRVDVWGGAAWDPNGATLDTDITTSFGMRLGSAPVAVAWSGPSSALAAYHRDSSGFRWASWGGSWKLETDVVAMPALPAKASFLPFSPIPGETVMLVATTDGKLWAKRFADGRWTDTEGGQALEVELAATAPVPMTVDTR
ncbi:MAG: hypothetical protein KF819_30990 [Labilithrix sp.]|nr:hypothetical protein [Labilithrix sp.]